MSTAEKLTTVALALEFKDPEIQRCLYDNPRDIWGASYKILSLWWQRVISDEDRWQQLYSALHKVLPYQEIEEFDTTIRNADNGKNLIYLCLIAMIELHKGVHINYGWGGD